MSPTTRSINKRAEARHHRRRTAQERLARDLFQAQQAAEVVDQARNPGGVIWPDRPSLDTREAASPIISTRRTNPNSSSRVLLTSARVLPWSSATASRA
jgi:hypothetical protein